MLLVLLMLLVLFLFFVLLLLLLLLVLLPLVVAALWRRLQLPLWRDVQRRLLTEDVQVVVLYVLVFAVEST